MGGIANQMKVHQLTLPHIDLLTLHEANGWHCDFEQTSEDTERRCLVIVTSEKNYNGNL